MSFVYSPSAATFSQSIKIVQRGPFFTSNGKQPGHNLNPYKNVNSLPDVNGMSMMDNPQRPSIDSRKGQLTNSSYTMNDSQSARNPNQNNKLTEMSSDLARLKQQLSKIMNQADKFQKKTIKSNLTGNLSGQILQKPQIHQRNNNTQQKRYDSFPNKSYEHSEQRINHSFDKTLYQRITEVGNTKINNSNSSSMNRLKTNKQYINPQEYVVKNPASNNIVHSQSEKYLNLPPNNGSTNQYLKYQQPQPQLKIKRTQDQSQKLQKTAIQNHTQNQSINFTIGRKDLKTDFKTHYSQNNDNGDPYHDSSINSTHYSRAETVQQVPKSQKFNFQPEVQKFKPFDVNKYLLKNNLQYGASQFSKNNKFEEVFSPNNTNGDSFNLGQLTYKEKERQMINPTPQITLNKKDSSKSNQSHEMVLNKIITQQYSKKLQQSTQFQQLKRRKAKDQFQFQQKIIELEHEKRKLNHELNNAVLQKQNLQLSLKTQKTQKQTLTKKYNQISETLHINKLELEDYRTRCKLLQNKLDTQLSRPKNIRSENPSFDEALKQQFSQINKYKDKLEQKDEEIIRLRDLSTMNRRETEALNNQIKIQQLKAASLLNEAQQKHDIMLQDRQNDIKTLKNLITTLQSKLSFAIKQNKSKDAFMVQHLTGKAKIGEQKQCIERFFKKYEVEFPTNRLHQKIKEEQIQIEKLKRTILQMAGGKLN